MLNVPPSMLNTHARAKSLAWGVDINSAQGARTGTVTVTIGVSVIAREVRGPERHDGMHRHRRSGSVPQPTM